MTKRAAGFGKASKLKKAKAETDSAINDNTAKVDNSSKNDNTSKDDTKESLEDNEAELNIVLSDEEEDDELAEIYGLYSKLQKDRDFRIARGLVHECDQLLRKRDQENQSLPDKFHVVYGGALLTLAKSTEEDHKQFRDAGVERINTGLTSSNVESVALAGLELLQYVHTQSKDGKLSAPGKKVLDHILNLLRKLSSKEHLELGKTAFKLLQLADEVDLDSKASSLAFKVLETQTNSKDPDTQRWGHKGLGQYWLNVAAPALDKEEPETVSSEIDQALNHLRLALAEDDQESHVMLAQILLQWASINDDDEKAYAEALKHLKKARMLGHDGLGEIIESLENE